MLAHLVLASLLLSLAVGGCSKKEPTSPPEPAKPEAAAPSAVKPEAPQAMPEPAMPPMPEAPVVADIVDTAVAAGSFNTLVAAIKAAGLVGTLKGLGPFTVFAPTDAAFAKLPAGTLETLLLPQSKDKLTAILTYHVVAGKMMAAHVAGMQAADTVNGQKLSIGIQGGAVMLNGQAKVTKTDIVCSNGVIHVIDTVLLPPETAPAAATPDDAQVKEAQSLLDQVLAYIKERKLDLAQSGLEKLEAMKGLPPDMADKIQAARKSLDLAKTAGEVKFP
jgi:uncharacterized surface protein with fasciclin (FAS1) repeats